MEEFSCLFPNTKQVFFRVNASRKQWPHRYLTANWPSPAWISQGIAYLDYAIAVGRWSRSAYKISLSSLGHCPFKSRSFFLSFFSSKAISQPRFLVSIASDGEEAQRGMRAAALDPRGGGVRLLPPGLLCPVRFIPSAGGSLLGVGGRRRGVDAEGSPARRGLLQRAGASGAMGARRQMGRRFQIELVGWVLPRLQGHVWQWRAVPLQLLGVLRG